MTPRAKTLMIAMLVAIPALAYTCPCFGHNGRDADPVEFEDPGTSESHPATDIFSGITVSTDARTGVRTYTQTGDVPPNPARASKSASAEPMAHGVDFWVDPTFHGNQQASGGNYYANEQPASQISSYSDGYYGDSYGYGYGYGGYLPGLGYGGGGGRPGRPGHGGGGGRPGRPGGGNEQPGTPAGGYNLPPRSRYSPPPGPAGGGVGSPPPYQFGGVGAPSPVLRYNTFGGRRR